MRRTARDFYERVGSRERAAVKRTRKGAASLLRSYTIGPKTKRISSRDETRESRNANGRSTLRLDATTAGGLGELKFDFARYMHGNEIRSSGRPARWPWRRIVKIAWPGPINTKRGFSVPVSRFLARSLARRRFSLSLSPTLSPLSPLSFALRDPSSLVLPTLRAFRGRLPSSSCACTPFSARARRVRVRQREREKKRERKSVRNRDKR